MQGKARLLKTYGAIKPVIRKRLKELASNRDRPDRHVFAELAFCICTPLSKAVHCNEAVNELERTGVLFKGSAGDIRAYLGRVRFNRNKSRYIVNAREYLTDNGRIRIKNKLDVSNVFETRKWLDRNIPGIGFKEASHFLRNLGFGKDLAILDVHVLKNLKEFKVIRNIPDPVSKKRYLLIEDKMREFAKRINIPLIELDFLLWYNETGVIVK